MSVAERMSALKGLKPIVIKGKEYLPLIEGGKGVAATNGRSSGAFAAEGGSGTVSGVNGDRYDSAGNIIPIVYNNSDKVETLGIQRDLNKLILERRFLIIKYY